MQKMHWCTAKVNLSGQNLMIVWFDQFNAISWPEAQVLMALHGEENVFDVVPALIGDCNIMAEKTRLAMKYRPAPVETVFPGRNPRMETLMPGHEQLLPAADAEGHPVPGAAPIKLENGNGHPIEEPEQNIPQPIPPQPENEDDEEEDAAAPIDPANPPPAVFKPGRHRPHKGA